MILFFDRSVGTAIPKALCEYLKPPRLQVEYHEMHFDQAEQDDVWLAEIGKRGWFVIGQDHSYHENSPELVAIKTYSVGAFYLWGSEAPKWETMRVFAKAYDHIVDLSTKTPRPFVYRVLQHGGKPQEIYL